MELLCHNCHYEVDEDFSGIIDSDLIKSQYKLTKEYCEKCKSIYRSIAFEGCEKLLILLCREILLCTNCDSYLIIDKGKTFNCSLCENFFDKCKKKFKKLCSKSIYEYSLADYGFPQIDNDNCLHECIGVHDFNIHKEKMKNMTINEKIQFLINILSYTNIDFEYS